jgi:hypothetical protein
MDVVQDPIGIEPERSLGRGQQKQGGCKPYGPIPKTPSEKIDQTYTQASEKKTHPLGCIHGRSKESVAPRQHIRVKGGHLCDRPSGQGLINTFFKDLHSPGEVVPLIRGDGPPDPMRVQIERKEEQDHQKG